MGSSFTVPDDLVSIKIFVEGKQIPETWSVAEIRVQRQINRITQAKVFLLDGNISTETFLMSESHTFVPGNKIEIQLGYHDKDQSIFKGVIAKHGLKVHKAQAYLVVACVDQAIKMTIGRKSSFFVKKTDSAIIEELIQASHLSAEVESTSVEHKTVIRYYASDWDFMLARAEAAGKVVLVEDGKIIVRAPNFAHDSEVDVCYGQSLRAFDAQIDAATQFPSVSCSSWDFSQQKLITEYSTEPAASPSGNLSGHSLSGALGQTAFTLQTAAPLSEVELKTWANAQLLKLRLSSLRGTASLHGNAKLLPGRTLTMSGLGARFNGKAFISSVSHHIKDGEWHSEVGLGLSPRWFTEEQPDIEAPPAAGLVPGIHGLLSGKVKQIDQDPDGQTRVLVNVPLIEPNGSGVWARLASGYATDNAGIFFMPELEDEVILGFLNNDPAFPIILGSLYSSTRTPPYTPDQKNTHKAIVTKAQIKITIDDQKKQIQISTPGGHVLTLNDEDQTVSLSDSNKNHLKMSSSGITLQSPANIMLKADGKIDIQAQSNITLKSSMQVNAEAPNINAKASMALSAQGQGSAQLTSSGEVTIRGTIVMIN